MPRFQPCFRVYPGVYAEVSISKNMKGLVGESVAQHAVHGAYPGQHG
jgi:hypothetical protein